MRLQFFNSAVMANSKLDYCKKKPEDSLKLQRPPLHVISYSYHTYDLFLFVSGNTVNTLIATTSRKRPPPRNVSEHFEDNRFASQSNKCTVLNTLASDHYLNFLTTATIFFSFF